MAGKIMICRCEDVTLSDLEHCVSSFEQIVEFGNAAKHLESCKAQIRQVDQQLTPEEF